MVRPCCICGIKKNSEAATKGIRFFKFPSAKSESHSNWIKTIRHHSTKISRPFTPRRNSIVCSSHFEDSCFNRSYRKLQLKQGSIPTIFNFDDSSKEVVSTACDVTSKADEEKEGNTEGNASSSSLRDYASDGSSSLSPPVLLPLQDVNSDFEETIEDPPDLELYHINHDYDESTGLTSFADLDMIKMDHIGSVADILGPDPYMQDESIVMDERPDSSVGEERDEVDGQTILSFTSAEEMHEFAHREASSRLTKTNDFRQIKGWRNKFQQLTPSLSPSPCSSPVSLPARSAISASENSKSPLPTHFSRLCQNPSTSFEMKNIKENRATCEKISPDLDTQRPTSPVEEGCIVPSEETTETSEEMANSSLESTLPLPDLIAHSEETKESFQEERKEPLEEGTKKPLEEETKEPLEEETSELLEETAELMEETAEPSDESIEAFPELGIDGLISYDYANFAASAACFPFDEKRGKIVKKADNSLTASKKVSPRPKNSATRIRINKQSAVQHVQILPSVDIDEIPSGDMTDFDDSLEEVVFQEEEYVEDYVVPGNLVLPTADCGQLFCRLGCICDLLIKTKNRTKVSVEHCGLPECMLQCVCGYQKGKPSSRKCFASLLKGNESFYSKINWSGERRRRERRVPERFSEFHLGNESSSSVSNRSSEEFKHVESKSKNNSHHRAGNSHSSRSSSPFKNASPPQSHSVSPQSVQESLPCPPTNRKWEPFRVKVCADEIKLLRWDSFVSLSKVYVAPEHDIFCMEHTMYGCPCIETDRRIIRIASEYVPLPIINTTKNTQNKSPTSSAKKGKAKNVTSSPSAKNVAKKHTNPNMRLATKSKVMEENAAPAPQPVAKTSSLSKMRKILSDERFQLQKLMTEEKTRAFDEEVDLTVRQGQTVQLVAWIRFHRIYHAGRIHIRFLSRRAGPVILVMRPTEIVAADITCDIQDMKGNTNSPEIVKELLDPCISPEETSRYAFLLCDGVKWELVGCLSLKASNDAPPPTSTVRPASLDTPTLFPSPQHSISTTEVPSIELDEQNAQQKRVAAQMKFLARCPPRTRDEVSPDPSAIQRSSALELKRMQLEERLSVINSKLTLQPPKQSVSFKQFKNKSRPSMAPILQPILPTVSVVEAPVIVEELSPLSLSVADPSIQAPRPKTVRRTGKRKPDMTYLIPDQSILPDDPEEMPIVSLTEELPEAHPTKNSQNLPDSVVSQEEKDPNQTLYPAAEKLAMFSRLIINSRNDSMSGGTYSNFEDSSMTASKLSRPAKRPPPKLERIPTPPLPVAVPLPLIAPESTVPNISPSEMTFIKLQPIGSSLPNGISGQNTVRRIRILTPNSTVNGGSGNSLLPVLTSRNGWEPNLIQQQRLHWSSKGVKPPVNAKITPTPVISDSLITVLPVPTSLGAGQNVSTLTSSCATNASDMVQFIGPVPNQDGKTPAIITSDLQVPDWSTQLLMKANAVTSTSVSLTGVKLLQQKQRGKSTSPPLINAESSKETESTSCVFPKILTAEVITVKSPPGNASQRLKIIYEAMVGQHRDFCPSRASMILPLQNVDDQWCIVAINQVPDSGFQVPGVTVFIPRDMLGRAASAAMERKARVSFPLHFKLKNDGSALKSGFEVYGTPQLPHHVFVGPFPFNYIESYTPLSMLNNNVCMFVIKLTKPIPVSVSDCAKEVQQLKPTEQTEEVIQSTVTKSTVKTPEPISETSPSTIEEVSVTSTPDSSNKSSSEADHTPSSEATEVSESTLLNTKDSESVKIHIVDEKINSNPKSLSQQPGSSLLRQSIQSESVNRAKKPVRMFVARTPGLPPVNIKLFSEDAVVVDHPLLCGEKMFLSLEKAKTWLQTLAISNCKGKKSSNISNSGSEKSKTSNSAEDSWANSNFTEDEEIDITIEEVSVTSTPVSSNKSSSEADHTPSSEATEVSESTLLNTKDSESVEIQIVDEKINSNPKSLSQRPGSSLLRQPIQSESVNRAKKPVRMFVARTSGLPPVNIKLFSEDAVIVDHPLLCGEKKMFSSLEKAKTWLQTLAISNCKGKKSSNISNSGSEKSKTSNSAEDSWANSDFTEDEEIDVCGQTQGESQEQEETVDSASTSRSPKRIRRMTEKARILAASKSKSSRNSGSTASNFKRSQDKLPPPRKVGSSRKNSLQRMLHIQKEQERRGLLGKLIRDLDALCASSSGTRAKIVVLKNATILVGQLEQQAKEMEALYQNLKEQRTTLLTQREQIFNKLPPNASQIFSCFMESVPLPSRHLAMIENNRIKRYRPQVPDQQSRNRVAVVVPNNSLLSESVDVAQGLDCGYVLTGVES